MTGKAARARADAASDDSMRAVDPSFCSRATPASSAGAFAGYVRALSRSALSLVHQR
jgi:hypothetical protein